MESAIKRFSNNFVEWRSEKRSFWNHLTLVNATVLGFSVTTTQIKNIVDPNIFLVISWLALILSVIFGLILLKKDQDQKISSDIQSFEYKYNLEEIERLYSDGKISKDKRDGLLIAAISFEGKIEDRLKEEGQMFSTLARELINKYGSELPSKRILKDSPVKKNFLLKAFEQLTNFIYLKHSDWIYYLTVIAYLSMLLSVLTGPYVKVLFPLNA